LLGKKSAQQDEASLEAAAVLEIEGVGVGGFLPAGQLLEGEKKVLSPVRAAFGSGSQGFFVKIFPVCGSGLPMGCHRPIRRQIRHGIFQGRTINYKGLGSGRSLGGIRR